MAMKVHGNVQGEVRVNLVALFCLETPHFHVCCSQIVPNCSCERSFEHCHSRSFLVPDRWEIRGAQKTNGEFELPGPKRMKCL